MDKMRDWNIILYIQQIYSEYKSEIPYYQVRQLKLLLMDFNLLN